MAKCLENFVSQALGLFTRFYAAELRNTTFCSGLINILSVKDSHYNQLYMVKDGGTEGLYTMQGEMLFPTGLFRNVGLYKKGVSLSSDPYDGINSNLMSMLKSTGGMGYSVDETKFDYIYIKTFNNFKERLIYYYDLKGNLICDTRKEKAFDVNFDLGQKEFAGKHYNKAIEYYRQALTIKQDGVTYYNIGAALYNLNKYKEAINSLELCINQNPRQSVIDKARDLLIDCKSRLQQRKERRADVVMGILGSIFNVASTIIQTNVAIKSYNNTPSNFKLPPSLNPQLSAQNAVNHINAQMNAQKNQFLTQFRNNYRLTMGREPTEIEEMEAYTQFLQSMNAVNQSSSGSYSSTTVSLPNNGHTMTSETNKCGLCNGSGRIEDSVDNFGISEKKWCSECNEYRINGHYHKNCPSCKGKGYR